jgi:putative ABC transport system permease protein
MAAITLHGMWARRVRSALTLLAVLLGVTMIAGTFVFTDTINRSFGDIFRHAARGADAVVSGAGADRNVSNQAPTAPATLVARLAHLPGVAHAEGQISDSASLVARNGRVVNTGGAPTLALSYMHAPFQALVISAGRAPAGPDEVAIDQATAAEQHVRLGQRVQVAAQGPVRAFTLVGFVRFGNASVGGATFLVFDLPTAQRLFLKQGRVDSILLQAAPGVSPAALVRRVAPLLGGPTLQVRTAAAQVRRDTNQIAQQVGFITDALLVFGFLAVLVGAFVIFNTFSITVAQRTREFGMLRTLGATRRQVLGSVVAEGLAIGVTGAVAGVALGLLTADGISALFKAAGAKLPSTSPVLESRTIIVGLAVGIGVTLAAALAPALRATRVPPVAALREGELPPRARLAFLGPWIAVLILAGGIVLTLIGGPGGGGLSTAVVGALLVIAGLAFLGPQIVIPAARAAGWPMERLTAVVGRLARENAMRNPGRTATTAGALMVGLGVALFLAIFANGARVSIRDVIARSFTGDLAIVNRDGSSPIPVAAADAAGAVSGVQATSVFKQADAKVLGAGSGFVHAHGIDPATIGYVYHFNWAQGSDDVVGLLGPLGALVERRLADRAHLIVGSTFTVRNRAGQFMPLFVRGIYRDRALLDGFVVGLPAFTGLFQERRASLVLVKLAPGVDRARVQRMLIGALSAYPIVIARSQRQLADDEAGRLNTVLALFYGLLAMSLVVSLFGIVNTLTLSVYERTRELGVLRAVGMSRRQVRRLVRYESVITAAIGAALGLALGVFFAAVVASALSDQSFEFAIPWGQLVLLIAITLVLGVLAAVAPARRAARLDVLAAIAHE